MESTIDPANKVEIPREVMEKFHLAPGMSLVIEASRNGILLKPRVDDPNLRYVNGGLVYVGPVIPPGVIDPVEQLREDRLNEAFRAIDGKAE